MTIVTKWHGGKGSKRRPEKEGAYQDQWEKIFGKPEPKVKEHMLTPYPFFSLIPLDKTKYDLKKLDRTEISNIIDT